MRFNSGISCLSTFTNLVTRQQLNAPDPDIPELFDELEGANVLEDLGLGDLPRVASRVSRWDAGRIPSACYDWIIEPDLLGGSCDPREVEVYEVTYDDCEEPWVVCRCKDADEDLDQLVTDLGQLPVRARDYVRYVIMSDHKRLEGVYELEGSAVWWEGDLVIYGNWSSVGLFVHEVSHTLDYFVSGQEDVPFSETPEFEEILDDDTCVADYYSKTTYSEAYAQAAVLLAFDLNRSGPLDDIVDHDCMSGVYDVLNDQIGDLLTYDSGETCRRPLRKSSTLCLQNGRFSRCRDGGSNISDDNDSNSDDDDNGGSSGGNNNDDDSNTGSNGGDNDSAGVRLSMGSVPMAVFWGVGQVFRAVGVM